MQAYSLREKIAKLLEELHDDRQMPWQEQADRILAIPEIAEGLRAKDELDDRASWAGGDPI